MLATGEPNTLAKAFNYWRFQDGSLIDEHGAAGVAH
jgi:sarcosine oxidase subunit beta